VAQPDRSLKVVLVEDRREVADAHDVGSVRRYRLAACGSTVAPPIRKPDSST
jgi:hypothetical protein